jgi:hypothetical protein
VPIVLAFFMSFEEKEQEIVELRKMRTFVAKGTQTKADSGMQIEERVQKHREVVQYRFLEVRIAVIWHKNRDKVLYNFLGKIGTKIEATYSL